jgi:hypothetical protein
MRASPEAALAAARRRALGATHTATAAHPRGAQRGLLCRARCHRSRPPAPPRGAQVPGALGLVRGSVRVRHPKAHQAEPGEGHLHLYKQRAATHGCVRATTLARPANAAGRCRAGSSTRSSTNAPRALRVPIWR